MSGLKFDPKENISLAVRAATQEYVEEALGSDTSWPIPMSNITHIGMFARGLMFLVQRISQAVGIDEDAALDEFCQAMSGEVYEDDINFHRVLKLPVPDDLRVTVAAKGQQYKR